MVSIRKFYSRVNLAYHASSKANHYWFLNKIYDTIKMVLHFGMEKHNDI